MKDYAINPARRVIYNSLVKPHLMYNIVVLQLTRKDKEQLISAHRASVPPTSTWHILTRVLSGKAAGKQPIEVDIAYQKCVFLGNVLQKSVQTAVNRAMIMHDEAKKSSLGLA